MEEKRISEINNDIYFILTKETNCSKMKNLHIILEKQ